MIFESAEYAMIKSYYGTATSKRSRVPLMNHVHEGLLILQAIGAHEVVQRAWCIHPIVQDENHDRMLMVRMPSPDPILFTNSPPISMTAGYAYALEYAAAANAYLCRPENDFIYTAKNLALHLQQKGVRITKPTLQLLLADKLQNRQDFLLYHEGTHLRTAQLRTYFDVWIEYIRKCLKATDTD